MKDDSTTVTAKSFCCNNCGSPLKIPKNSKGRVRCSFCKTDCILEGLVKNADIAVKENIESGIPLLASPAILHRKLVSLLSESPNMPPDVFEKVEVIREERYCVPAYCFHCNGTEAFTYDVANIRQRQNLTDLSGNNTTVRTEYYEEWDNGKSSIAAVRQTVFASGNRKLASPIERLYMHFDPKKLIDIEELEFPPDVDTCNCDLPPTVSFNKYAAPYIEKLLKEKAEDNLAKQNHRNLQMGGANIQKDITRVFLGLYHIVFKYDNKEYSIWVTGDGTKVCHDGLPEVKKNTHLIETIVYHRKMLEEKQREYDRMSAKDKDKKKLGAGCIGVIFTIPAIVFAVFDLDITAFIIIEIMLCIIMVFSTNRKKDAYKKKRAQFLQEEIEPLEAELSKLMLLSTTEALRSNKTVQQFREQKKALRGIYEHVSGDINAFYG